MILKDFYDEVLKENLILWTISNPRKKSERVKKILIRPVSISGKKMYQIESFTQEQAFHENVNEEGLFLSVNKILAEHPYRQYDIFTENKDFHVLISKKGQMNIHRDDPTKQASEISHNQQKQYILKEGDPIPFLVELGVMTPTGKVVDKRFNKFKQINRFVEMVDDVIEELLKTYEAETDQAFRIVDFGSGKSYLTFALYHYLVNIKHLKVDIIGLDLKADVIRNCNELKDRLAYEGLRFIVGDIEQFDEINQLDMVVTLHACNTATDAALKKAVTWGAKVILSVPCCQKEFNKQIDKNAFNGLLEHGLIKERVSALMTDAIRAKWLDAMGYTVQLLEFVDMSHTPKNIMIRGLKTRDKKADKLKELEDLEATLGVSLSIMK